MKHVLWLLLQLILLGAVDGAFASQHLFIGSNRRKFICWQFISHVRIYTCTIGRQRHGNETWSSLEIMCVGDVIKAILLRDESRPIPSASHAHCLPNNISMLLVAGGETKCRLANTVSVSKVVPQICIETFPGENETFFPLYVNSEVKGIDVAQLLSIALE